jgi:glycine/D-amino acid oxidase-like deaminating enzyme
LAKPCRQISHFTKIRLSTRSARAGGFTLVCPEGSVRAPKLIIAANLFAEEMGFKKHRAVSIVSFGTLTWQLADDEKKHVGGGEFGVLPASPSGSTVRLTADGHILMRNTLWYARSKRFEDDLIAEHWPALGEVDFKGTWSGIMAFTRNEGTVWGAVADDLYILMTTGTAPMTRSTVLGKLFAKDLSCVDSEELRTLKAMPQAAFMPPDPI